MPRALRSIFGTKPAPKSDSESSPSRRSASHRRSPSVDSSLAEINDMAMALWNGTGRSIGNFIKGRSRRSSSSATERSILPSSPTINESQHTTLNDPSPSPTRVGERQDSASVPKKRPSSIAGTRNESDPIAYSSSEDGEVSAAVVENATHTDHHDAPLDTKEPTGGAPNPDYSSSRPPSPLAVTSEVSSEPGEVNDAAYDSDDHEEDEDVTTPDDTPTTPTDYSSPPPSSDTHKSSKPHSHMGEADAESIIGGVPSKVASPANTPTTAGRKTFSFSLPFSNPLASLEFPNFKLPSIFSNETSTESIESLRLDVNDRLDRQISITSLDEVKLYNDIRAQDNARLRAVKRAFTPNITLNPLAVPKLEPFPSIEGDVVVLGGYRGSILRDRASGRRVWIPIKAGFNLRKIDLTVGPRDEDEYEMSNKIYPDGMLTHIGPVDISRKLIKKLRSSRNCKVYEFGYDWRLSSDINSRRLRKFLESLPSNKNFKDDGRRRKGAIVIAHSMGGLIAHHAMQQDPTLFRGLVYVGVPASCPNILGPLRLGDSVLLSSKILTPQVNFLMRSSYAFLPISGRCFVNRKDPSIKYDIDFFDVNTWIKYKLSPLVTKDYAKTFSSDAADVRMSIPNFRRKEHMKGMTFSTDAKAAQENERTKTFTLPDQKIIDYDEAVEYLDRTLKRTKKFILELEYDPEKSHLYPPLVTLYSHSVPTVRGSKVDDMDGISTDIYDDLLYGAGDGVVYHKWTMPEPKGFKVVAKIAADRGHVELLNDIDAVGRTLNAILAAEKETLKARAPATSTDNTPLSNGVLSPIDVR